VQAEADDLRSQNQQLNKQFAAASSEVKTLKAQVRGKGGRRRRARRQLPRLARLCPCLLPGVSPDPAAAAAPSSLSPPPPPPQVAQLSEAVQSEKFELMNAGQENERLREQIVQSPEKFQRSLADLQARRGGGGGAGRGRAGGDA
jgi:outer membrane murein-binding lipoprotein Lpp